MQRIFTKREKIILYLTITVIIVSLAFNFIIAPVLKRFELLNEQIEIARATLKKYILLLGKKDYIQQSYSKFSSGLNPSDAGNYTLVTTLQALEALAKESEIRIIDIRPQTPQNLPLYKEVIIDLRTEGSQEGYLKFFYTIENSLALLRINKFRLNSKPNSKTLEANFSISQILLPE